MIDSIDFMFHDTGIHIDSHDVPHDPAHSMADLHSNPHAESHAEQTNLGGSEHVGSGGHGIGDSILSTLGAPAIHFGQEMGWLDADADIHLWHEQQHPDTCAIVSQEIILESLTGQNFSEDELMHEAQHNGWYIPGGGTPWDHVGDLIEAHGIPIDRGHDNTIHDLETILERGDKVIVGVNGDDIWNPHTPSFFESLLSEIPFMPGQHADHAVQVVSIDRSNPDNPIVVLNDSGTPNGAGERVSLATFEQAWSTSDHFMVNTNTA